MDTRKLKIEFAQDNRNTIRNAPARIPQLMQILDKTVIPLAEASMLTLFQSSTQYRRTNCNASLNFTGANVILNFELQYTSPGHVGSDVTQDDIAQDCDKIKQRVGQGCKLEAVNIDPKTGIISIKGVIQ